MLRKVMQVRKREKKMEKKYKIMKAGTGGGIGHEGGMGVHKEGSAGEGKRKRRMEEKCKISKSSRMRKRRKKKRMRNACTLLVEIALLHRCATLENTSARNRGVLRRQRHPNSSVHMCFIIPKRNIH